MLGRGWSDTALKYYVTLKMRESGLSEKLHAIDSVCESVEAEVSKAISKVAGTRNEDKKSAQD